MSFNQNIRRSALVEIDNARILAIETDNPFLDPTPPGADYVVTVKTIPLDRRHNAKTDYSALRKILKAQKALSATRH